MIRAPRHFNGTFISRHFFPNYFKNDALSGINTGKCYDWAYFAHRLFGVQLWTTDYHAWVQVHNCGPQHARCFQRFFDSETPNGVSNFMALRCNIRNSYPLPWETQPPVRMEVTDFMEFWNEYGGGKKRHWNTHLEPQLREVLGKRFSELTPIFSVRA